MSIPGGARPVCTPDGDCAVAVVANDKVYDWLLAFLESYRENNPAIPLHVIPFDDNVFLAVHIELLVKRGVTLMEHLKLSELAADGCHEFFFSVGALPVTGAAGSPINPIAVG